MKYWIWQLSWIVATLFVFTACSQIPRIKLEKVGQVTAPKNANTPAEIVKEEGQDTLPIPAGTEVKFHRGVDFSEWTFVLKADSSFHSEVQKLRAQTGTVSEDVAKEAIKQKSREKMLYIGGFLILVGVIAVANPLVKWPLGGALFIGAGVLFVVSYLYPSFFLYAVIAASIAGGLIFGGEIMERMVKKTSTEVIA